MRGFVDCSDVGRVGAVRFPLFQVVDETPRSLVVSEGIGISYLL